MMRILTAGTDEVGNFPSERRMGGLIAGAWISSAEL